MSQGESSERVDKLFKWLATGNKLGNLLDETKYLMSREDIKPFEVAYLNFIACQTCLRLKRYKDGIEYGKNVISNIDNFGGQAIHWVWLCRDLGSCHLMQYLSGDKNVEYLNAAEKLLNIAIDTINETRWPVTVRHAFIKKDSRSIQGMMQQLRELREEGMGQSSASTALCTEFGERTGSTPSPVCQDCSGQKMEFVGEARVGIIRWCLLNFFGLFPDVARAFGENHVYRCPQCSGERVFKRGRSGWKEIFPALRN